jgi:hypothetical protein
MKIHEDGTITDLTKLEKLEIKFWEEYHALPDLPDPDEFTHMTSEEQQAVMDEHASALHAIHMKYKTHLWMPSKMGVHK